MGPRDQLSSYDPAPESIHGSDSLPNPPQRGPEAIGRHIDSMMASQSPLGTNTNTKIKLSPLVQVLIALGVVALIAIMVLVWTTVFGTKKSDTTALDPSQTITTPTVSVPQLAPSAVPTTPERSLPDSLHENLPPEIASHVPQEIRDNVVSCHAAAAFGFVFGLQSAQSTSCTWVNMADAESEYGHGTVLFTTDKKLAESARKPLVMKKQDISLKPTQGHDILVSSLSSPGTNFVYITDFASDGATIVYFIEGGKNEAEAFLKKFHLAE